MRNTKTPRGVACLLVRGLKAVYAEEQWPKELKLLAETIDEMAMVVEMEAEEGHGPFGQNRRDADWLFELGDELESLAPATKEA